MHLDKLTLHEAYLSQEEIYREMHMLSVSYKNGTHFQVALISHHFKNFINLSPLNYCSHIVRYFLSSCSCCV